MTRLPPIIFPGEDGYEEARALAVQTFEGAVWWWSDLFEANQERYHNAMEGKTGEGLHWSMQDSDDLTPILEAELEALNAKDPAGFEAVRKSWGAHFDANEDTFHTRFRG